MTESVRNNLFSQHLDDRNFKRLIDFIHDKYGINITSSKRIMLEGRLYKRLRENNLDTFEAYINFLFSEEGMKNELYHMIDTVTTNKTDFFRENHHFEYLRDRYLPSLKSNQKLNVWSAGCSTGEEPYTIAIILEEFCRSSGLDLDYAVLSTDLSTRVLKQTREAVYAEERINIIPLELKKRYFLKSKDRQNPKVRVVNQLRSKIKIARLNFMDEHYNIPGCYDVIFCRNVLIYFDKPTQEMVLQKLCAKLNSGGVLFIGHSESVTGFDLPIEQVKPTVFIKQ